MRTIPLLALVTGCTTLGPMPTTTGISGVPGERTAGEVSGGLMPIFRLSSAASGDDRNGKTTPIVGALFDPAKIVPGLFVSARLWGEHGDTGLEPQVGYRRHLDDRFSVGGVVYGTRMSDDENGATYKATRFGGEAMVDAMVAELSELVQIHVQGAVAATYIKSSGTYCVDAATGNAIDCSQDQMLPTVDGRLSGVFPSATLQLALDAGHHTTGAFHSARLAGMVSAGWMPRVVDGDQRAGDPYISGGLSLTLALGAAQ